MYFDEVTITIIIIRLQFFRVVTSGIERFPLGYTRFFKFPFLHALLLFQI